MSNDDFSVKIRDTLPEGYEHNRVTEFLSLLSTPGPDMCWEWQGRRNVKGYGQFRVNGRTRGAHRIAYELFVGVNPGELFVCHRCDNPPCCNPTHLFLGTHQDNIDDMIAKGRNKIAAFVGRRIKSPPTLNRRKKRKFLKRNEMFAYAIKPARYIVIEKDRRLPKYGNSIKLSPVGITRRKSRKPKERIVYTKSVRLKPLTEIERWRKKLDDAKQDGIRKHYSDTR